MYGRITIIMAGIVALGLLALLAIGYANRALHQVQPYYARAIELDSEMLAQDSHAMECRIASLVTDATTDSSWQTAFSEREVNGWLAVALKEKFADLLPESVVDPRVDFGANEAAIGFRYVGEELSTVISVRVSVWVAETDVVAIRLKKCHAGTLPIPVSKVVDQMIAAADKLNASLRWTQQAGDPVALISLRGVLSVADEQRCLQSVELYEGELYLAGSTASVEPLLAEKAEETVLR